MVSLLTVQNWMPQYDYIYIDFVSRRLSLASFILSCYREMPTRIRGEGQTKGIRRKNHHCKSEFQALRCRRSRRYQSGPHTVTELVDMKKWQHLELLLLSLWLHLSNEVDAFGFSAVDLLTTCGEVVSRAAGISSCIILLSSTPTMTTTSPTANYEWNLMNGQVILPRDIKLPLSMINGVESKNGDTPNFLRLSNPKLIGAGGGGAVFSFDNSDDGTSYNDILLKVSWDKSSQSVQNECHILQKLQHIPTIEDCVGVYPYPIPADDGGNFNFKKNEQLSNKRGRVMIALRPYIRESVSSINDLSTTKLQGNAVKQVSQTMIRMLYSNTITVDVQPLFDVTNGDATFIDFTEAKTIASAVVRDGDNGEAGLSRQELPHQRDQQQLVSSFVSEMMALIPEKYLLDAARAVDEELSILNQQQETLYNLILSDETMEVLNAQVLDLLH